VDDKVGGVGVEVDEKVVGGGDVVKLVNGGRDDIGGRILFEGALAEGGRRLDEGFEVTGICANDCSTHIDSKNKLNRISERIKGYLIKN
jgi:hypothetical protein